MIEGKEEQSLCCAYEYVGEPERVCPLPRSWQTADGIPSQLPALLPIDSKGLCLFHSFDEAWKGANDFLQCFHRLLKLGAKKLESERPSLLQQDRFDCRGFVFVKKRGDTLIDLSHQIFQHKLDLVDSCFLDRVDFQGSVFEESAYFERARFHSYAHFVQCRFKKSAYFSRAEFDDFVVFRDTEFLGVTSFCDTRFPKSAATYFENLVIGKTLIFKGLTREKSVFSNTVSLSVAAGSGSVSFENANIRFLDEPSRAHIKTLETQGRVRIGPGCDKYRVSKTLSLPYRQRHKILLREIAQAFVEFFNYDGLLNGSVGVEIEYSEDLATIRYFSDIEVIGSTFEEALERAVPRFIKFLQNPDESLKLPVTLAEWDAYRSSKFVQLGLMPRVAHGENWSFEDTLNVLRVCPGPIGLDVVRYLHGHLGNTLIQAGGDVKIVVTNVNNAGSSIKIEPIMGDQFKDISNSTIVNRSIVAQSGNVFSPERVAEIRRLLGDVRSEAKNLNQETLSAPLDDLEKELARPEPDRSKIKVMWEKVVTVAPQVGSVAEAVAKVTSLLQ